jgi:hypothetical protein
MDESDLIPMFSGYCAQQRAPNVGLYPLGDGAGLRPQEKVARATFDRLYDFGVEIGRRNFECAGHGRQPDVAIVARHEPGRAHGGFCRVGTRAAFAGVRLCHLSSPDEIRRHATDSNSVQTTIYATYARQGNDFLTAFFRLRFSTAVDAACGRAVRTQALMLGSMSAASATRRIKNGKV